MVIIGFRIGMAARTTKFCKVIWVDMAIQTFIPFAFMCSTINREVLTIVIKGSRCPRSIIMARSAVGRKLSSGVIWIIRTIVVTLVTTYAGIGRIRVVSIVAGIAITRYCCVCAG